MVPVSGILSLGRYSVTGLRLPSVVGRFGAAFALLAASFAVTGCPLTDDYYVQDDAGTGGASGAGNVGTSDLGTGGREERPSTQRR
jgi:hypothetical protein